MNDVPYTNADLDAAEHQLVSLGRQGEAEAFRQYTQGIRNLIQGEWGQSFLGALESLGERQAQTIVAALHQEVSALKDQFQSDISHLRTRLDRKRQRLDNHDARLDEQQRQIDELRQIVAARPAQRAAEQDALVGKIVERLRAEVDSGQ